MLSSPVEPFLDSLGSPRPGLQQSKAPESLPGHVQTFQEGEVLIKMRRQGGGAALQLQAAVFMIQSGVRARCNGLTQFEVLMPGLTTRGPHLQEGYATHHEIYMHPKYHTHHDQTGHELVDPEAEVGPDSSEQDLNPSHVFWLVETFSGTQL